MSGSSVASETDRMRWLGLLGFLSGAVVGGAGIYLGTLFIPAIPASTFNVSGGLYGLIQSPASSQLSSALFLTALFILPISYVAVLLANRIRDGVRTWNRYSLIQSFLVGCLWISSSASGLLSNVLLHVQHQLLIDVIIVWSAAVVAIGACREKPRHAFSHVANGLLVSVSFFLAVAPTVFVTWFLLWKLNLGDAGLPKADDRWLVPMVLAAGALAVACSFAKGGRKK